MGNYGVYRRYPIERIVQRPRLLLDITVDIQVAVSDGLTIGESVTVDPLLLEDISVADGLTVGDTASVSIPAAGVEDLNINISPAANWIQIV